ncbi:unnamed protein product [Lota lota]
MFFFLNCLEHKPTTPRYPQDHPDTPQCPGLTSTPWVPLTAVIREPEACWLLSPVPVFSSKRPESQLSPQLWSVIGAGPVGQTWPTGLAWQPKARSSGDLLLVIPV